MSIKLTHVVKCADGSVLVTVDGAPHPIRFAKESTASHLVDQFREILDAVREPDEPVKRPSVFSRFGVWFASLRARRWAGTMPASPQADVIRPGDQAGPGADDFTTFRPHSPQPSSNPTAELHPEPQVRPDAPDVKAIVAQEVAAGGKVIFTNLEYDNSAFRLTVPTVSETAVLQDASIGLFTHGGAILKELMAEVERVYVPAMIPTEVSPAPAPAQSAPAPEAGAPTPHMESVERPSPAPEETTAITDEEAEYLGQSGAPQEEPVNAPVPLTGVTQEPLPEGESSPPPTSYQREADRAIRFPAQPGESRSIRGQLEVRKMEGESVQTDIGIREKGVLHPVLVTDHDRTRLIEHLPEGGGVTATLDETRQPVDLEVAASGRRFPTHHDFLNEPGFTQHPTGLEPEPEVQSARSEVAEVSSPVQEPATPEVPGPLPAPEPLPEAPTLVGEPSAEERAAAIEEMRPRSPSELAHALDDMDEVAGPSAEQAPRKGPRLPHLAPVTPGEL
jgi:hypothetical protein